MCVCVCVCLCVCYYESQGYLCSFFSVLQITWHRWVVGINSHQAAGILKCCFLFIITVQWDTFYFPDRCQVNKAVIAVALITSYQASLQRPPFCSSAYSENNHFSVTALLEASVCDTAVNSAEIKALIWDVSSLVWKINYDKLSVILKIQPLYFL